MTVLPQADRFSDHPSDSPYWNESAWFSVSKPEERIHGMIQYYFRPNMGMLNGGPVLWDPSGTNQWDCLYYNWSHLQAMPPGAAKFDMTARNSLSVKVLEPLRRYAIRYDQPDFKMDLEWEANAPIHVLTTADPAQAETAKFHLEQPGRMRGRIWVQGREIEIDCLSMRDTSFGPRDYDSLSSGGYFWGIAENSSFHAIAIGEGNLQKIIGGYLWRDGQMSSLVAGSREVLEFGRYGPLRVQFEATDKLGRRISAIGRIEEGLIFTGYTDHTVLWSLTEWNWDDVVHWGDNQEFCSTANFRAIARGEIRPGGR